MCLDLVSVLDIFLVVVPLLSKRVSNLFSTLWFFLVCIYIVPQTSVQSEQICVFVIFKGDVFRDVFSEPRHTNTQHKEKK